MKLTIYAPSFLLIFLFASAASAPKQRPPKPLANRTAISVGEILQLTENKSRENIITTFGHGFHEDKTTIVYIAFGEKAFYGALDDRSREMCWRSILCGMTVYNDWNGIIYQSITFIFQDDIPLLTEFDHLVCYGLRHPLRGECRYQYR